MKNPVVAIVRYEKPMELVRKVVDLYSGLHHLSPGSKIFIKPNIDEHVKSLQGRHSRESGSVPPQRD